MHSGIEKSLILTLFVLLVGTPLPWGHTHDSLDAQQLEVHLRVHHADSDGELPCDWHTHLLWLHAASIGAAADTPATDLVETSLNPLEEHLRGGVDMVALDAVDDSRGQPTADGTDSHALLSARGLRLRETYKRHGVLRI